MPVFFSVSHKKKDIKNPLTVKLDKAITQPLSYNLIKYQVRLNTYKKEGVRRLLRARKFGCMVHILITPLPEWKDTSRQSRVVA